MVGMEKEEESSFSGQEPFLFVSMKLYILNVPSTNGEQPALLIFVVVQDLIFSFCQI